MKTQSWKLIAAIIGLPLAALACANLLNAGGNRSGNLPGEGRLATMVTETMEALAGDVSIPVDPASAAVFDALPDGLRIAYVSEGNLWLWSAEVGAKMAYSGDEVYDLRFSDDGTLVAFMTRIEDRQVVEGVRFSHFWVVNSDGSNLRQLLNAATVNALSPIPGRALGAVPYHWQFVPGTHTLAFNTRLLFTGPGVVVQDDLRLLDVDAGSVSTLLDVDQGGKFSYSPDGSQMALVRPGEIDLVNADGGNRRDNVLTHPIVNTASDYHFYAIPRWHSDSSQLSVVIPSAQPFGDIPSMSVWTIPADGSSPSLESEFPGGMAVFYSDLMLSPDFSKVAYMERFGEPSDTIWEMRAANLDGSGDTVLHTGKFRFTSWDRSSSGVVYSEGGSFFLVNLNDGSIQPLTDHPPAQEISWIDEEWFLYFSGEAYSGSYDLRIGSIGGPSVSIGPVNTEFLVFAISK